MKLFKSVNIAMVSAMTLLGITVSGSDLLAQQSEVDPAAVQAFQKMTEFVANLEGFSVSTQVTLEELLDNGQRIDVDIYANVVIQRPNKLRAARLGDGVSQSFYYNGETLTLYDPVNKVYATEAAPKTIEGVLDYTRENLGLIIPVADLVYRNAFELLMQDVNFAAVVGDAIIGGVHCTHLAFGRPDVDFQVWVADGDVPYPCKYVVTDTSSPALMSTVTVMGDWVFDPETDAAVFYFVPPADAQAVSFLPYNSSSEN